MSKASRKKPASQKAPKEKGGIQSLERAFAILEQVARKQDGINLVDLSRAVGLHNSTTFHLVKTMVQLGYISQMRESKRYRIGSRLFTLAAGALEENSYLELATPVLEKLSRDTGEAAHFAIRSGNEIVLIARTAGSGMLQLSDRTGNTRPAHATALGKVLLAALPPQDLAQFLAGMEMRRYTAKTIVGREALLRELEEVRKRGIAFDDGEFDAELRCVAVPVYDFAGRVAGAIGISGPIWRLSLQALQDTARQARVSAAELSTGLGFRKRSEATARSS
jgi:DNA-binding IclR family transcriptional regulator